MKAKRACLLRWGTTVEDRGGAQQVVGVAFIVGVDRDQADLGVGGALIEGEVRGAAFGCSRGGFQRAGGSFKDDVLGGFGGARAFRG